MRPCWCPQQQAQPIEYAHTRAARYMCLHKFIGNAFNE